LIADMTIWRMRGLLNGFCRQFARSISTPPVGSCTATRTFLFLFRSGSRSWVAYSHQSTSPFCNAAAADAGSGVVRHSMRSKWVILGPEVQSGVPPSRGR